MLRLYDTAKAQYVEVAPRAAGEFSMYCCGPTVYDLPHLGHGRAMLTWDLFRRYLEWSGLRVRHVANVTDIDDKIIERSRALGTSTAELSAKYEDEWWQATDRLGALRPTDTPHATEYVEQMVSLIDDLVRRGAAYETSDGVYFAVEQVPGYGLLARQSVESLRAGARVDVNEEKRSPIDFALWKKADPVADPPTWPSPWGPGRPGWHTECVVMSLGLLGDGFDLHGGGLDLAFPHHENERAQALAWGHDFCQLWVHHGFVEVSGEKMSKSLGNFTSLTDLLERTDPRAYRLVVYRAHYRSPIDVTPDVLADARAALGRLDSLARRLGEAPKAAAGLAAVRAAGADYDQDAVSSFVGVMDDDLDTPDAVGLVFDLIRRSNTAFDDGATAQGAVLARTALELAAAIGITAVAGEADVDPDTMALVRARDEARAARNWARSDELRTALQERGWVVEDTREGTKIRR